MKERTTALNYIYLSRKHAGGKDQVALNLLKGLSEDNLTGDKVIICYDYLTETIKSLAPDIEVIEVKSRPFWEKNELFRMFSVSMFNTFKLRKIVKKNGIKVVHHLSCNTGLRKLPCKSIVLPHDIKAISHRVLANVKVPWYKYLIYKIMYAIDFKKNDVIVAISDTDKAEITEFYPKRANKIKRIYNPIDLPRVTLVDDREYENYFTAINLQFHHKNIITLIKAFELIKDEIPQDLYLMGNVPSRVNYLKEYVQQHKLDDRIHFTGFVSDEERNTRLRNCRLYINPTLYEGFGMTAVEAIINGVPTLVSKIPTNYEVTKGCCYYYEPAEDASALAVAIKDAIADKWTNAQDKSDALQDEYDYRVIASKYDELYKGDNK